MTVAVTVCAGCGTAGHPQSKCPERRILRIPAFIDTDPVPFEVTIEGFILIDGDLGRPSDGPNLPCAVEPS